MSPIEGLTKITAFVEAWEEPLGILFLVGTLRLILAVQTTHNG